MHIVRAFVNGDGNCLFHSFFGSEVPYEPGHCDNMRKHQTECPTASEGDYVKSQVARRALVNNYLEPHEMLLNAPKMLMVDGKFELLTGTGLTDVR